MYRRQPRGEPVRRDLTLYMFFQRKRWLPTDCRLIFSLKLINFVAVIDAGVARRRGKRNNA
jgi:hypothetical protein